MSIMDLKKNAPKGEFLAYINKKEAAMLKKAGGSGELVNGIPSFRPEDFGQEARSKEKGFDQSDKSNPYSDASKSAQAAENKSISDRHKERVEKIARHDYGPKKNIFQKMAAYDKRYKNAWATKQKQKQLTAIDKMIAKNYTANPHMDIAEIRDALMSQYDGTTNTMTGLESFNVGKPGMNYGPTQLGPLGLKTTNSKGEPLSTKYMDTTPSLYSHPSNTPSIMGQILGKVSPPNINNLMSGFNKINQLSDIQKNGVTQAEITDYYDRSMGRGKYDIFGGGNGDGQQPLIPIDYNTGAGTTETVEPYTNDFEYRFGNTQGVGDDVTQGFYNQGGRARRAEGGIMELRARRAFGGIMDRVTGRKAYGLGSIFKSVGKAVSGVAKAAGKVLSSDVGKMALMAAGTYYMGGGMKFGGAKMFGNTANSTFMGNLGRVGTFIKDNPFKSIGIASAALPFLAGGAKPNEDIGMGNRGGHLIDPLTGKEALPSEMRASLNEKLANADGDPIRIKQINDAYAFMIPKEELGTYSPYRTYGVKDGGRIGRAEGGLMDLGGMEKDYRAEGGFVPIGAKEKADDVPARLSVNEFVFTADAVRGAGGGDIDKGAEIMENMMVNLEKGGTVSEESQGNAGAQQMFNTSQRLGEVI
jgi:hypothetical protein